MKPMEEPTVILATIAEERTNPALEIAVNRGIAYAKLMGQDEGRKLMKIAGVPDEIINRVFEKKSFRQPTLAILS